MAMTVSNDRNRLLGVTMVNSRSASVSQRYAVFAAAINRPVAWLLLHWTERVADEAMLRQRGFITTGDLFSSCGSSVRRRSSPCSTLLASAVFP